MFVSRVCRLWTKQESDLVSQKEDFEGAAEKRVDFSGPETNAKYRCETPRKRKYYK